MRGHAGFDNIYLTYSPTFSCMDNILFGCGLCALLRTRSRETVKRLAPRVLAVTASLILIIGILNHDFLWKDSAMVPTLGFSLVGISCASIIAMAGAQIRIFECGTLNFHLIGVKRHARPYAGWTRTDEALE